MTQSSVGIGSHLQDHHHLGTRAIGSLGPLVDLPGCSLSCSLVEAYRKVGFASELNA